MNIKEFVNVFSGNLNALNYVVHSLMLHAPREVLEELHDTLMLERARGKYGLIHHEPDEIKELNGLITDIRICHSQRFTRGVWRSNMTYDIENFDAAFVAYVDKLNID